MVIGIRNSWLSRFLKQHSEQFRSILKEGFRNQTRFEEEIVYNEDGKTLAQVAQRGGGCPIPGDI